MTMATPSIDEVRNRRFISPSPPLFPSLEEISPLPVTHLNSIKAYLTDWRADRRYDRRPQPPTPTRMAAKNRSISTAIPGPSFGTSRRLTTMQKTNKSCLTPLLSPEKARRPSHRTSISTKTDFPPSSYHLPKSLLPRSDSLLTDFEKDEHFERVFNSPEVHPNKALGLSKSQTTPALLSPNRDITSHSLLKPIGPPIPRSNTYNDLPSAQIHSTSPSRIQHGTSKVCFEDVKMSERLDVQIPRFKSPYPQLSEGPLSRMPRRQVSTSRVPSYTTDGAGPSVVEILNNPETYPRFVHTYELSSYWTGRYVALLDRLRTRSFVPPPPSKNALARGNIAAKKIPNPKETREFDRIEINIEKEAMKILRSFCQTPAATQSFEQFEYLIRKKHIESMRRSNTSPSSSIADVDNKDKDVSNSQCLVALNDPKTDRWMLSRALPQGIFRKASSTVQQPKFEKSVTTGNFCQPQFYLGSDSSFEGTENLHGPMQHSASTLTLSSIDCKPLHRILPKTNNDSSRTALTTPSNHRLNTGASRNFSHRDVRQTVCPVDSEPPLTQTSADSTDTTTPSVNDNLVVQSSRRFRKSDSIKNLVDHSIREMKKMGKRKVTSGTADEMGET